MTIRSIRVIYVKNIAKTSSFSRNSAFPPLCPLKQRLRTSNPPIPRKPVNPRNKRAKERKEKKKRTNIQAFPLLFPSSLHQTVSRAGQFASRNEPGNHKGGDSVRGSDTGSNRILRARERRRGKERRGKDARTQTAYCFSLELISRNGFAKNRRRRMRTRRVYNNSLVQNRERKRGGILFGARKERAGNRSRSSAVLLSRLAFMKYPRHSFHTDSPAARRVHS